MAAINSNAKLYDITNKYPDVKAIMIELGFKDIIKPGMLQSMGKFMTIEKGAKAKNIEWDLIAKAFQNYGYELVKE